MSTIKAWTAQAAGNAFIVGLVCWALFMTATHKWPASEWMDVRSVEVLPARAGEPVRMVVDREIKQSFVASWVVSVRKHNNGMELVCVGSGTSNYRQGADLPGVLTLGWWTSGACETLPPGRYFVATDWTIHPGGIFPAKTIRADSKPFEVAP
jgi:hypothetical protein